MSHVGFLLSLVPHVTCLGLVPHVTRRVLATYYIYTPLLLMHPVSLLLLLLFSLFYCSGGCFAVFFVCFITVLRVARPRTQTPRSPKHRAGMQESPVPA